MSSLKTLEYIATGLPVFTTNVLGQEFISENKIGVNIKIENVNQEFQKFINNIKEYKINVDKFRKENINTLSWMRVAIETEKFIDELITK